jgi:hypothetical protein
MRKFNVGGVEVTSVMGPGHTPGQLQNIVPVVHNGETHKLLVWSGNDQLSEAARYAVSTEFLTGVAKQEGADAWLNTHAYQSAAFAYLRDLKDDPGAYNPFIMGTEGLQQHLQVFSLCQRAGEQRVLDGTWNQM